MAQGIDPAQERADAGEDPLQRQMLRDQLDRVAEEKRRALDDPGPTWREWALQSAAKWWIGLGFLIVDAWLIAGLYDLGVAAFVYVGSLALAFYAEFLVWRVLWYEPGDFRRKFRRTWYRPVAYGRWTPEADYFRAHPTDAESLSREEFV
jgi:hypothetical protein